MWIESCVNITFSVVGMFVPRTYVLLSSRVIDVLGVKRPAKRATLFAVAVSPVIGRFFCHIFRQEGGCWVGTGGVLKAPVVRRWRFLYFCWHLC